MSWYEYHVKEYRKNGNENYTFILRDDGSPCVIDREKYTINGEPVTKDWFDACAWFGYCHPTTIEYVWMNVPHGRWPIWFSFDGGIKIDSRQSPDRTAERLTVYYGDFEVAICTKTECFSLANSEQRIEKVTKEELVDTISAIGGPLDILKSICAKLGILLPSRKSCAFVCYMAKIGERETVLIHETPRYGMAIITRINVRSSNVNFTIYYTEYNGPDDDETIDFYWGANACNVFYFREKLDEWLGHRLSVFGALPLPIGDAIQQYLPLGCPKELRQLEYGDFDIKHGKCIYQDKEYPPEEFINLISTKS